MRYALARIEQQSRDELFRSYVARSLRAIPKGEYVEAQYADLAYPLPVDPRSGDEIAEDVIRRLGLEVTA
nr:MAG TPA: hypothetical protein [Caudoviricetes sp.]